jgi:hypothetical protein
VASTQSRPSKATFLSFGKRVNHKWTFTKVKPLDLAALWNRKIKLAFAKPEIETARPTSAVGPPVTDEHSRHKLLLFR